jgi:hypothetical protein
MLTEDFTPRLRSLRRQAEAACSRATEMADRSYLDWPFFESATALAALDAWARRARRRMLHGPDVDAEPAARWCARWARRLAAHAVGGAYGARRSHRHPRDLPDPRDAGAPQRPGRLRLRDAGPGLGRDQPAGHAGAAGSATSPVARGEAIAAFALSSPSAGSDVAAMQCAPHRGDHGGAERREDLDLQRRHRRLLRRVLPHRRGAGRARHLGLHRRCRHAGASRSPSASR